MNSDALEGLFYFCVCVMFVNNFYMRVVFIAVLMVSC